MIRNQNSIFLKLIQDVDRDQKTMILLTDNGQWLESKQIHCEIHLSEFGLTTITFDCPS